MHLILLGTQGLCALVGFVCFFKCKRSYWSWFSVYLVFIFFQEAYWTFNPSLLGIKKPVYYGFLGIPVQYLFFFWLYAYKSLKNKRLFRIFSLVYLATYIPFELYYKKIDFVYSINLTTGTILLAFLVVMEYLKQIKNEDILRFKENKMFYINVGVILFYIGTYPFFAFADVLTKEPYLGIGNAYYIYFLLSNYIMYLLFAASFVWGKHPLN